jgi:intracellular sulfur oxidation DsrE/DsrF family protein
MSSDSARRMFLSRLGAGAAVFGGLFARDGDRVDAQARGGAQATWQPTRHAEDDWLDLIPGQHRMFFDTTTPVALALGLRFAANYFSVNQSAYHLTNDQVAVVICVRHRSTPFAYDAAIWTKYAGPLSERAEFVDPRTKQPPTLNVFQKNDYGSDLPNNGVTLDALIARGIRFAVCQTSTHGFAATIAEKTHQTADAVYNELAAHLIPNARLVPAGIVAVNRAQERGYSISAVG